MTVLQSFHLNGKLALITGSSAGIGFALARALGEAGAHVILNGRNAEKVAAAAATLQAEGLQVSQSVFDVTQAKDVAAAVHQIESEVGALDILINNAGMQIRGPLHEYKDEDWHTLMRTNLDSVYFVGKTVAQKMIPRGSGKIINICSVQSELGRPGIAPYTASKGAVKMLTKGNSCQVRRRMLGQPSCKAYFELYRPEKLILVAQSPINLLDRKLCHRRSAVEAIFRTFDACNLLIYIGFL